MAECFCGCGRPIRFSKRSTSKRGKIVAQRLGELESCGSDLPSDWLPELTNALQAGRQFVAAFQSICHEETASSYYGLKTFDHWVDSTRLLLGLSKLNEERQRFFTEHGESLSDRHLWQMMNQLLAEEGTSWKRISL